MKNPWIHKDGKSKIDKRSTQHQSQKKKAAANKRKKK
jgi:hypothetical protein